MSREITHKISIASIITLALFVIGGFITQYNIVDSKIADAKSDADLNNTAVVQRVASLETDSATLKDNVKEIRSDVKELLKRVK